jgi:transcriptional regulator with XRE-family HTH domain
MAHSQWDMTWVGLGQRLREARKQRGMFGEQVARKLGCHVRTLYRWERGEFEPSIAMLARLADLYGVSPTYLVNGKKERAA